MNATEAHQQLVQHEAAHAVAGALAGRRSAGVWVLPPDEIATAERTDVAGAANFHTAGATRDQRCISLLAGMLADGWQPRWPLEAGSSHPDDDERKLAELLREQDELVLLDHVHEAKRLMSTPAYKRGHRLAVALLEHTGELSGEQVHDLLEMSMNTDAPSTKALAQLDEARAAQLIAMLSDLEAALDLRDETEAEVKAKPPIEIKSFGC